MAPSSWYIRAMPNAQDAKLNTCANNVGSTSTYPKSFIQVNLFISSSPYATVPALDGSPGLVVMGGHSCSKGREFESWHCILDGHFHIYLL